MNRQRSDADAGSTAGPQPDEPDELGALLREYWAHPSRRADIQAAIHERYGRDAAVLVIDSSGFTATVKRLGIVHFLALLEVLNGIVQPAVDEAGGRVVAREGDTVFALFDSADVALRVAIAIQDALSVANAEVAEADRIWCAMGLGFGPMLVAGGRIAGDEVNVAFKLGEDTAEAGQILISESARLALRHAPPLTERRVSIADVVLVAHEVGHHGGTPS